MSKPISLFSGYSQRENRVTNYCLLILKMLYEENPKYLGEVLGALCGDDFASHVGVSFRQQERRGGSIPDGLIVQHPFTVYIETKNYDWFYDEQLERHLAALDCEVTGEKILIALGNFETNDLNRFIRVRDLCETKYRQTILFRAVAFEDLAGALLIPGLSKNLSDAVSDFRGFLNEEDLLPSWREWLDVINCAGLPEDITEGGVYMCPAESGAYNHGRARFFGMYRDKRVELVAEIEAVADIDLQNGASAVKWKNLPGSDDEYLSRAVAKVREMRPTDGPTRVFLLGSLYPTNFQKDSPGGMFSSKRYFNIAGLDALDASELARYLDGRRWSEFE
ncbi:MAG TPA: hypothetical protein VF816_00005 [Rhodocyclaceae bacterium]